MTLKRSSPGDGEKPDHNALAIKPDLAERYRRSGAWSDGSVWQEVCRHADVNPDQLAFVDAKRRLTFAQLVAEASGLASALQDRGVTAGDRVVVQLPNWVEMPVAYFALSSMAAITVPQSIIYRDADLEHVITTTGAVALIVPGEESGHDHVAMAQRLVERCPTLCLVISVRSPKDHVEALERLVQTPGEPGPGPNPDDIDVILFTSGSTGRSKGCAHTTNSMRFIAETLSDDVFHLGRGDVFFLSSPATHTSGFTTGVLATTRSGIASVLMDKWDPALARETIAREGCTVSMGATTFLTGLADVCTGEPGELGAFRLFAVGGAPIPESVVDRVAAKLDCELVTMYGCTESQPGTYTRLGDPPARVLTSDGRAARHVELKILDPAGVEVPAGTPGEIVMRSPGRMAFYWNDEAATAEAIDSDGFVHTRDIGRVDRDGYLRVVGRTKDIIVRGGLNISAFEVEEHLLHHPEVLDVAVVGYPDDRLGERACAVIVASQPHLDLAALREFLAKRGVAKPKWPERILLVDQLPRTATGKIEKFRLRDVAAG